ncbi:MAG: hypothetical protein OEZ36_11300, partial [Spirochaetota bacterium]|nr:hypothetical protein [Spirochaetota bacterium]
HPKLKTRIPVGGDVIVAVDGQNVKTPWDITLALEKKKINDIISIDIVRYLGDRKYEKLKINLTLLPSK